MTQDAESVVAEAFSREWNEHSHNAGVDAEIAIRALTDAVWTLVPPTEQIDGPPPCARCGQPCFKVPVPAHPGDDAWVWSHDCPPAHRRRIKVTKTYVIVTRMLYRSKCQLCDWESMDCGSIQDAEKLAQYHQETHVNGYQAGFTAARLRADLPTGDTRKGSE